MKPVRVARNVAYGLIIWGFLVISSGWLWTRYPKSGLGWVFLLVLSPLAAGFKEIVMTGAFKLVTSRPLMQRFGRWLDGLSRPGSSSFVRIVILTVIAVVLIAVIMGASYAIEKHLLARN